MPQQSRAVEKSRGLLNNNESKEVILQKPLGVPFEPKGRARKGRRGSQLCSCGNWRISCGLEWRLRRGNLKPPAEKLLQEDELI
ncbi:hypothetical protein RHMOL_Rhmol10G0146500 [Rhododendron molle]|uniref:Uncharacterized protein n=1 Tax=Rhododendron molle TaxID=49168 RepID=A0ACC0M3E6_RHOML|nr:hypothetical protein RHMOL_Rhmol10G0146500 [Rhododendron molle]